MQKVVPFFLIFLASHSYSQQKHTGLRTIQGTPFAQTIIKDSISVIANAKYGEASKFKKFFLGENYRKEWAAETTLPLLQLSTLYGGLRPVKQGGGMQSVSLRLTDSMGREWALRSVNKRTESLIPEELHGTFVQDVLDDATSAQHPYSALMIPALANAVNVAHAHPIIGVVAQDSLLGEYAPLFEHTVALLEEREPLGDSDNSPKTVRKLQEDNDDNFKAKAYLRARMLDVLVSDWDRHEDQWRWYDENQDSTDQDKDYIPIPRDRDQALRVTQGFLMKDIYQQFVNPVMQGFTTGIPDIRYSLFKSRFLNAHPSNQLSHREWAKEVKQFVTRLTDSVLWQSVQSLPQSSITIRGEQIFKTLQSRRDALPTAMEEYYNFINNIVDIHLSDKNEKVEICSTGSKNLKVKVSKINKVGKVTKTLMDKTYKNTLTKEIRLYLGDGKDSVLIDNAQSPIKLRIIGDSTPKTYVINQSKSRIQLYENTKNSVMLGEKNKIKLHYAQDSINTQFVPVNLYNTWLPLVTAGYNADDGISLGLGSAYTHQRGFRKSPFTYRQQLTVATAFRTGAYKIHYRGEWTAAAGDADIVIDALAKAPDNTQNFFGVGNNSPFLEEQYGAKYYRSRFNIFNINPQLRWKPSSTLNVAVGPHIQFYHLDPNENEDRFILNPQALHSYDSLSITKDKAFAGINAFLTQDSRNRKINPSKGMYIKADLNSYFGLNQYSKNSAQLNAAITGYFSVLNEGIIFANRTGGGAVVGNPTFYQYLFLGGHENLRGFRQYRFAGQQMLYNNLEARLKIKDVRSYVLPGEFGLMGMYDIGKVWAKGYNSGKFHQGVGGGIYYIVADALPLHFVMTRSDEGWYPYFSTGFRF
ncbi:MULTISPECIES: BamA/TamA family outer membrane protein [unclassified Sphingobacterium]|uniref:BamA/TamA family outer membrane protein n=1 Tax=unclassified Sphingobacterium TaxID=2609468 RepID=UPI0025E3AB36|nr:MULTISPECIES: BamA/TamA family outer membrane protein [unclassified Sphingobacterium]